MTARKRKGGIRVQVEYTKRNGKRVRFWADAPANMEVPASDDQGWAQTAANKMHPGARDAKIVTRG